MALAIVTVPPAAANSIALLLSETLFLARLLSVVESLPLTVGAAAAGAAAAGASCVSIAKGQTRFHFAVQISKAKKRKKYQTVSH